MSGFAVKTTLREQIRKEILDEINKTTTLLLEHFCAQTVWLHILFLFVTSSTYFTTLPQISTQKYKFYHFEGEGVVPQRKFANT